MKDYEDLKPIIVEKGKGPYLYDLEGKRYIAAISSWWHLFFSFFKGALKSQYWMKMKKYKLMLCNVIEFIDMNNETVYILNMLCRENSRELYKKHKNSI